MIAACWRSYWRTLSLLVLAFISALYLREPSSQAPVPPQPRYQSIAARWRPRWKPHWRTSSLHVRITFASAFAFVLHHPRYGNFSFDNSLFRHLRTSHWSLTWSRPRGTAWKDAGWRILRIACLFAWFHHGVGFMAKDTCCGHVTRSNTYVKHAYSR